MFCLRLCGIKMHPCVTKLGNLRKHLLSYSRQADLNLMLLCVRELNTNNVEQHNGNHLWLLQQISKTGLSWTVCSFKKVTKSSCETNTYYYESNFSTPWSKYISQKTFEKSFLNGWPYLRIQLLGKPVNTKACSGWHAAISQVYGTHTSIVYKPFNSQMNHFLVSPRVVRSVSGCISSKFPLF